MEEATVSLGWLLAAFVAGGYVGVFVMALMNIASYEPDRVISGFDARADD